MNLCSINDLKKNYPEQTLIELSSENNNINEEVITIAIEVASNEIQGNISGYSHKINEYNIPKLLNKLCCDLTLLNLYKRRQISTDFTIQLQKECSKLLEKLNQNKIDLNLEEEPEASSIFIISSNEIRGF